jgi:hypothetical protein
MPDKSDCRSALMFHVRGGVSDASFQNRGVDTSKAGISTGEELLDLEELPDPCKGIWAGADLELRRSCAAQRQLILSQPLGTICAEIPGLARRLRVSVKS